MGRKIGTMPTDPLFDILRERVRSPETFHASRGEVEHLIAKMDRLFVQVEALKETVALQKLMLEIRKSPTMFKEEVPVTGEP